MNTTIQASIESTVSAINESRPDDFSITADYSWGYYSIDLIIDGKITRLKTSLTPTECLLYLQGFSSGFDLGLDIPNY